MIKKLLAIFFMLTAFPLWGQQTAQYSQYMLNNYGINPAHGGFYDSWQVMAGRRKQWAGFENAPINNFIGVHKALAKKHYRNYWHGVGGYVEDDNAGLMNDKALYLSYSFHLRVSGRFTLSSGLFAGARQRGFSSSLYNPNDPALSLYPPEVLMWPDLIPGIALQSKKTFMGLTVRNLYKSRSEGKGRTLGTPSLLKPHFYFTAGRKIVSQTYYYTFIPSVHIRYQTAAWPSVDLNCMMYIKRRVGIGLTYRPHDAASAMLQVKIYKNIVVGFAYDYVLSRMRNAASNSQEIMFGFTPTGSDEFEPSRHVSECPMMEF
jgi:type IX secretion system PorP/SprF family membrane protein